MEGGSRNKDVLETGGVFERVRDRKTSECGGGLHSMRQPAAVYWTSFW